MKQIALGVFLVLLAVLAVPQAAAAQTASLGGQLGMGSLQVDPLLEGDEAVSSSQWLAAADVEFFPTEDLRIEGGWVGGFARNMAAGGEEAESMGAGMTASPWKIHGAVGYLVFEQDNLSVYGGLGYQLNRITLLHDEIVEGDRIRLTGMGFQGHAHAALGLMDDLAFSASVHGAPWYSWEYQQGTSAEKNIGGSSYSYNLSLKYQLPENLMENLAVQIGYTSQRTSISEFTFRAEEEERPSSSTRFSGFTVGASIEF